MRRFSRRWFTQVRYPERLRRHELDWFLENGWFRRGQSVFCSRFFFGDGGIHSLVWLRLALDRYRPSRGLRRVLRRNHRLFRTVVRPFTLSEEACALYERYRRALPFRDTLPSQLPLLLADRDDEDYIFDSREVAIYDGDRLIGYSLFDLGVRSVASIVGLYDPDYARYSLGMQTMLDEISFGIDSGRRYYYPGYVTRGCPALDYKLRLGEVDFYDPLQRCWRPRVELRWDDLPAARIVRRMDEARRWLEQDGVDYDAWLYPLWECAAGDPRALEQPHFIACGRDRAGASPKILSYDLERDSFRLDRCERIGGLIPADVRDELGCAGGFFDLLAIEQTLLESPCSQAIVRAAARL